MSNITWLQDAGCFHTWTNAISYAVKILIIMILLDRLLMRTGGFLILLTELWSRVLKAILTGTVFILIPLAIILPTQRWGICFILSLGIKDL